MFQKRSPQNRKGSLLGGPAATVGASHHPCTPHGRATPRWAPPARLTGKAAPAETACRGQARVDSSSEKGGVTSLVLLPTWVRGHFLSLLSHFYCPHLHAHLYPHSSKAIVTFCRGAGSSEPESCSLDFQLSHVLSLLA